MKNLTPTIEEIRRHWGLAVDIHRREKRLAEFDQMMEDLWEKAVTFGHNSLLTLPEKLDQNPFTTEEG